MVSVDGFVASDNPEEYWHNWNEEMGAYMMEFFKSVDTFIYGRKSYEEMIAYWPPLTDEFATEMNETPKFVFSNSLKTAVWNATVLDEDGLDHIRKIKGTAGKDMVLFAGPNLLESFIKSELVDEFRLIINPIVLGSGKPLFQNLEKKLFLKLNNSISFKCGNILLVYEPVYGKTL